MSWERTNIEALYRKYFVDMRKFEPFPMEVSLDNVVDFVLWLQEKSDN
jgi:hypothetical protein